MDISLGLVRVWRDDRHRSKGELTGLGQALGITIDPSDKRYRYTSCDYIRDLILPALAGDDHILVKWVDPTLVPPSLVAYATAAGIQQPQQRHTPRGVPNMAWNCPHGHPGIDDAYGFCPFCGAPKPGGPPPPPPTAVHITSGPLLPAQVGMMYNYQFNAADGTRPYAWSVMGALPNGMTLVGNRLTGAPTNDGTFNFGILVQDAVGDNDIANCNLQVNPAPAPPPPPPPPPTTPLTIISGHPVDGMIGVPYSHFVMVHGGTPPVTIAHANPLPPGLTFAGNQISGTPTAAGDTHVNFVVTDNAGGYLNEHYVLHVNPAPTTTTTPTLNITTGTNLGNVNAGATVDQWLETDQSVAHVVDWTQISGDLPPGTMLDYNGHLTGVPNTPGQYMFRAEATDTDTGAVAVMNFRITVRQTPGATPAHGNDGDFFDKLARKLGAPN